MEKNYKKGKCQKCGLKRKMLLPGDKIYRCGNRKCLLFSVRHELVQEKK